MLVRGLRHPNVVRILDRGRNEQGVPFLAMESIDGRTVADLLAQHGERMSIVDAAAIGCQVFQGLEAAHALTDLHRDIKPSNLIVTAIGHVMVIDLGIAKDEKHHLADRRISAYRHAAVRGTRALTVIKP